MIIVLVSLILSFISFQLSGRLIHLMMMYNLMLAIIPLVIQKVKCKVKILNILATMVWILFLPNSFYMFTDLIHIGNFTFKATTNIYEQIYIQDITPWMELISFVLIIGVGIWLGLKTIRIELKQYDARLTKPFIVILGILNAIGVYIGRYLRFNSWDILHPLNLLEAVISSLNWFSIQFLVLFSIFFIVIIWAYYYINER